MANHPHRNPLASYAPDGSTTTFAVPFAFLKNSHLVVRVNGATKTLTTDYTVTGGNGSQGSVVFGTAPAASTSAGKSYIRTNSTISVTSTAHGLSSGDYITVASATDTAANGKAIIAKVDANTFTFQTAASGANGTLSYTPRVTISSTYSQDTSNAMIRRWNDLGNPIDGPLAQEPNLASYSNQASKKRSVAERTEAQVGVAQGVYPDA